MYMPTPMEIVAAQAMRTDLPRSETRVLVRVTCATEMQVCAGLQVKKGTSELTIYDVDAKDFEQLLETRITPEIRRNAEKKMASALKKWTDPPATSNRPPQPAELFPGSLEKFLTGELDDVSPLPFTKLEYSTLDGEPLRWDGEQGKLIGSKKKTAAAA
jgi:hypothetical protein